MKAVRYSAYGSPDVISLEDVPEPEPAADRILVRTVAASVNPYDWHFLRGKPYLARAMMGFRHPRDQSLGADFAGVVESVGEELTGFAVGDEVFGMSVGTLTEVVRVSGDAVVRKPASVPFVDAAALPLAGLTALQGLRDVAKVEPGQRVLVNGAAGGIGTFAVQIGAILGAEVTGVTSTGNVELVRSLGATGVIDYRSADFTAGDQTWDVVFDLVGNHPLRELRRAVTPTGALVICAPRPGDWFAPLANMVGASLQDRFTSQRLLNLNTVRRVADLQQLADWMADGRLRSVIDRSYPLAESAEAIRYLEAGHARGKVVVRISDPGR